MEVIINRQREIVDSINNLATNYKKDSASRKTPDYVNKRLEALNNLWGEFHDNHKKLLTAETKTHDYFTHNVYATVKQQYEYLRDSLMSFTLSAPSMEETATSSKSDDLKSQQYTNFRAFLRVVRGIDVSKLTEKWQLEDKLEMLQDSWKEIKSLHLQIDNILVGTDEEYENHYTDHEITYEDTKAALHRKLNSSTHQEQVTPKVELPIFSGNYISWPTFMDLFVGAIHDNKGLTKAQKMRILKSKLRGEAERLVKHLSVTDDNYETCWDLLCHRYYNVQTLFNKHFSTFVEQPKMTKQSASELGRLYDVSMEMVHAIQNLGVETTTWDPVLVFHIIQKLDPETYKGYQRARKTPRELPSFDELMEFLNATFTALEPLTEKKNNSSTFQPQPQKQNGNNKDVNKNRNYLNNIKSKSFVTTRTVSDNRKCPVCKDNHILLFCKQFRNMESANKLDTINELNICRNCMYVHSDNICNSTKRCKTCGDLHHTYLHNTFNENNSSSSTRSLNSNHVVKDDQGVMLATAIIRVKSANGFYIKLRCLIDGGSQCSLITENAAQRLGLKRCNHGESVLGVGLQTNKSKGVVKLVCKSVYGNYTFSKDAHVMTKVLRRLPNYTFDKSSWTHVQGINLADPDFNISRDVDILFDAGIYANILLKRSIRGPPELPIAQQTKIGWILFGDHESQPKYNCFAVLNNLEEISQFWEMEDIADNTNTVMTSEDEYCEQLFETTTKRLPDGRYQVRIPMKKDFEAQLGESRPQAVAQFFQLERRISRDSFLGDNYKKFIHEYIQLHHMKLCNKSTKPSCFLPHHGVIRLESLTTKLRVVFNASAKTSSGNSLNELMLRGPNLQQDLQALLLRWRKYKYVYTADIEKFFRQILVADEDQGLQKIIWRDDKTDKLQSYQLCTVTYGTKSAPYLSMRTVKQLVKDDGHKYPLACETLNNQLFVDDLLSGHNDLATAKEIQQQLIDILQGGGFNLRKWTSNEPKLLESLPKEKISDKMFDFKHSQSNKTLGIKWNPCTDQFTFQRNVAADNTRRETKRSMLSSLSTLYDPLGWLAPVTVKAKILFQGVWTRGIDWDDDLPSDIHKEWVNLTQDMTHINNIAIPRWIGDTDNKIELHGFCDASEKSYGCVIFCRTVPENGEPTIQLVCAKTKLCPLKKDTKEKVSIPRLELTGAQLLSRLMKKVKEAIGNNNIETFGWTDSMVVLGWLSGDPSRWKTFVANRVREIISTMPPDCWSHVASEDNPADYASRGLLPSQLVNTRLWWEGPTWLKNGTNNDNCVIEPPTLEMKSIPTLQTYTLQLKGTTFIQELLHNNSSMTHVIRIVAWLLRFITNARVKTNKIQEKYLTTSEINKAHLLIIKDVQSTTFSDEITDIRTLSKVNTKSKLLPLYPVIDEEGILRVGGRLKHSNLQDAAKHPIIVPKDHRVTELLITRAHQNTLHGGARLTLAHLRSQYWIIGGNATVKKQLRRCVKCRRYSPCDNNQLMADFPAARVTPSPPFSHCGVDLSGMVEVKANKGRGIKTTKGYIAVFVCFSTKAVHLELVSDLTTDAFIAAFKRMCARRGAPKHMYSDNGTNFVGAARKLNKEYKEVLSYYINTEFMDHLANTGVQWHFNAAKFPSAGGLWESAVRSMKHHLKRVIGEQKLTFEEFTTLLTQIEACLNSRPLLLLNEDSDNLEYLTPGHFLINGPVLSPPVGTDIQDFRSRWQLTEKLHQDFWKMWSSDYLHSLQGRNKWQTVKNNVKIDDIVLIKEDNAPPAKWLLGRITALHPGKDGLVRVVTLKTKNGCIKRPIIKLCPLPVTQDGTAVQPSPTSSTKNDNKRSPQQSKGTKRKKTVSFVQRFNSVFTMMLMLFAFFITPSTQQLFKITSLDSTKLVYFDKVADLQIIQDEWKMVVYYNMTTYRENLNNIETYVSHLSNLCKSQTSYLALVTQLEHEISELKYNDALLSSSQGRRSRRGLVNAVGYVANSLFGVLDERFAEKYTEDIKLIQENEKHLQKLYKEQISIAEGEYNLLKRNELTMNKQFKLINYNIKELYVKGSKIQGETEKSAYITSSALAANVIISNLHRIQQLLLDVVTDLRSEHIDLHLLRPTQLQNQLNVIAGQLPSDLALPIQSQNIKDTYKLLRVRTKVTDGFMIFEVKIPLINKDLYELHYVIPIPQKLQDGRSLTIIPTTEYIAINLRKDMFLPFPQHQLQSCIHMDETHLLCPLNQPIHNIKDARTNCEAQLINNNKITECQTIHDNCRDKWIKLQRGGGAWLFSCCQERNVRIFCPAGMTSKLLSGTGLIALGQGCSLKGDTFTIHSHYNFNNRIDTDEILITIPQVSDINNFVSNSTYNLTTPNTHSQMLDDLKQKIDNIKLQQDNAVSSISPHDIHQYSIMYIAISIGTIFLFVWGICKYRGRRARRSISQQEDSPPAVQLALTPVRSAVARSRDATARCECEISAGVYSQSLPNLDKSVESVRECPKNACRIDKATSPINF